jgi:hypothetical protein
MIGEGQYDIFSVINRSSNWRGEAAKNALFQQLTPIYLFASDTSLQTV